MAHILQLWLRESRMVILPEHGTNVSFLFDLEQEIVGLTAVVSHPDEGLPTIDFGLKFRIIVEGLWRLIDSACIIVTGEDHGQWFGLSEPVNAPAKANARLANSRLRGIEVDWVTGDLKFKFADDLTLQIVSNSSGYESWVMWCGGEHFAAGASGGLV